MTAVPDGKRETPKRRVIYLLFSAAVTVGVFSYLFSHVSPADILDLVINVDRRGIAMFLVLSLSMSVFRSWRYLLLLRVSGYRPSPAALYLVVIVRNFFSDLLPARLGSLVYIYLVTSRLGVPFAATFASYSLAFLFDIVVLVPMVLVAALQIAGDTGLSPWVLSGFGVLVGVVALLLLWALPGIFGVAAGALRALRWPGEERRKKWSEAFTEAAREVREAREKRIFFRVFILSFLVRLTKYGALYVLLFALIGPLGYGFTRLPVSKVFVGLCSAEFAASLPISGIAGFGAYEGTWALVFSLLGFGQDIARLTSISHHLLTQVYGYLLGVLAVLILLLPVFRAERAQREVSDVASPLRFYTAVAGSTALVAGALWAAWILG